jgi:hypothetical protein
MTQQCPGIRFILKGSPYKSPYSATILGAIGVP